MCVIAVKPAGVKWPPVKYLRNCYWSNPDGAGLAWVDAKGLHIKKGYFTWASLQQEFAALRDYPVILHCRIATHGSVSTQNCHPFLLSNGVAMAHNGIIDVEPMDKDMTDSETFGKRFIEKFTLEELGQPHIKELLELSIGYSKIALLSKDGTITILNEHLGDTFKGVLFSNESFEDRRKYNAFGYSHHEDVPAKVKDAVAAASAANYAGKYDEYDEYDEYFNRYALGQDEEYVKDPFFVGIDSLGGGSKW